jgi:hypothetical protein
MFRRMDIILLFGIASKRNEVVTVEGGSVLV